MNRARGAITVTGPLGTAENETFTCGHCSKIVMIPHRADKDKIGALCKPCMHMVCTDCAAKGACEPFEKKIKAVEDRDRFLRSVGL